MQDEDLMLKNKINKLIDRVMDLKGVLQRKDDETLMLKNEIHMLRLQLQNQKQNFNGAQELELNDGNKNNVYTFIYDFCMIAGLIIEEKSYVEYTYKTKFSEDFYKVEKEVFENYVCKYSRFDLKTFLNYCIDLSMVKSEANRSCLYNSGEIRVYYISRAFIDTATGTDSKNRIRPVRAKRTENTEND